MANKTWLDKLSLGQIHTTRGSFVFWPPTTTYRKKISGKTFRLYATNPRKAEAQALALTIRRTGFPARVLKDQHQRDYAVWVRTDRDPRR